MKIPKPYTIKTCFKGQTHANKDYSCKLLSLGDNYDIIEAKNKEMEDIMVTSVRNGRDIQFFCEDSDICEVLINIT